MGSLSVIPSVELIVEKQKNVMMIGPHGCGKSHTVRGLSEDLGLNVAIFNCATMDPYIDFVGVPVPQKMVFDGVEVDNLKLVRPHKIDAADIIFFDETNRARPEVLNGILEILEERSVNGEKLSRLKSIFAAMNPLKSEDGSYKVSRLDSAFIDRFDHYFTITPSLDEEFLESRFDRKVVECIVKWWGDHNSKGSGYVSPRRLVKAASNYVEYESKDLFMSSFNPDDEVDATRLWVELESAFGRGKVFKDKKVSDAIEVKKATHDDDIVIKKIPTVVSGYRPSGIVDYIKKSMDSDYPDTTAHAYLKPGDRVDVLKPVLRVGPADKDILVVKDARIDYVDRTQHLCGSIKKGYISDEWKTLNFYARVTHLTVEYDSGAKMLYESIACPISNPFLTINTIIRDSGAESLRRSRINAIVDRIKRHIRRSPQRVLTQSMKPRIAVTAKLFDTMTMLNATRQRGVFFNMGEYVVLDTITATGTLVKDAVIEDEDTAEGDSEEIPF